jgi:hypothetical protein
MFTYYLKTPSTAPTAEHPLQVSCGHKPVAPSGRFRTKALVSVERSEEDFQNNRVSLAIFGAVSAVGGNTSLWDISIGHLQNRLLLFGQRFPALLH